MSPTQAAPGAAGVAPAGLSVARILNLLLPVGCLCFAILFGLADAIYVPDSAQYRLLAMGQRSSVPPPFSARILGPAIAGWLGRVTGLSVDTGFAILGIVCLALLIALIAGYLWTWRANLAIFAAVFLMPFWIDLFHDYYLPDLLHGALLAVMLACLYYGYTSLGLLLLFPAFLARESTILVAICLVFAGWRRIPRRSAIVGVLAVVAGRLTASHYGQGGPASVHELSGGSYIFGKLVWSLFKNVLGLPLWSNTLPECAPVWKAALPHGWHMGAIQSVGLCQPSLWGPGRTMLAWFGVFGLGPAFALIVWRHMLLPSALGGALWGRPAAPGLNVEGPQPGPILVFRFCLIYGLISILMTPILGASADRLTEYGWPFYFIALAWFTGRLAFLSRARAAALVCLHLATCWLAWFAFRQTTVSFIVAGLAVLLLNAGGYVSAARYFRVTEVPQK